MVLTFESLIPKFAPEKIEPENMAELSQVVALL